MSDDWQTDIPSFDAPHSLRSLMSEGQRLSSRAIPIREGNTAQLLYGHSGTYMSNHLQISQSPTVPYMSHRGDTIRHLSSTSSQTHKSHLIQKPERGACLSIPSKELTPFGVDEQPHLLLNPTQCTDKTVSGQCFLPEPEMSNLSNSEHFSGQICSNTQIPQQFSTSPKSKVDQGLSSDVLPQPYSQCNTSRTTLSHPGTQRLPISKSHNVLPSTQFIQSTAPSFVNDPNSYPTPATHLQTTTPLPTSDFSPVQFYSFVVLHESEDFETACRVCNILQEHGVGVGTTFCEGFECPGASPLTCIQDAVESCAYIILLMTKCFLSRWAEFQSNTVLMNSIHDPNRFDSVIPFLPMSDPMPLSKMPMAFRSLVALEEKSPVFSKNVQNTFKKHTILYRETQWKKEQQLKAHRQKMKELSDCMKSGIDLQEISEDTEFKQLIDKYIRLNGPSCQPELNQNQIFGPFQPSSADAAGPHQIIQINHAENVQIGNQNCMNVQQVPSDTKGVNIEDCKGSGEECGEWFEGKESTDRCEGCSD